MGHATLPTGARLVAAFAMAGASALMVPILIDTYPDLRLDRDQKSLYYLFVAVGVHVGWNSLGTKVNKEHGSGIGLGFRAAITTAVWILGLLAIWYGIQNMIDHGYDEPTEAVLDMFNRLGELAGLMLNMKLLGIAAVSGIIAGVLSETAGKHWN